MKKKIKDLTDKEMSDICVMQLISCTCENTKLIKCPLYHGECLRGFIRKLRYLNTEIEL